MTTTDSRTVRIGGGLGYFGDDVTAPGRLIRTGRIDYLVMDFLAEVTMSILQKQLRKDPQKGFAGDILPVLRDCLVDALDREVTIVCNAGGVNPTACAEAVRALADELGVADRVSVASVGGDGLLERLPALRAAGQDLENLETGESFKIVADRMASANAYIGAEPVVEALRRGANVVVTGRVADPSLTVAVLRHEFGWAADDWDHLAAGTVAGHLIECGAHVTGGNHQAAWEAVPAMEDIGFPIVEVNAEGRIELGKPEGSGGLVDEQTTIEQLLYEIADPRAYLSPDVSADWTSIQLRQIGPDLVELDGIRGNTAPERLKVSATYEDGFSAATMFLYSAPDAVGRARKALDVIEKRIARLGLEIDEIHHDLIGTGAVHGQRTPKTFTDEPCEVVLRIAMRSRSRGDLARAVAELSTVFHGPPGKTNLLPGRARISENLGYWPTLVDRNHVKPEVTLL